MRKANLKKRLLFLLAAVISLLNIAPLLWVALSSFKTRIEIFSTPPVWIPERWQVQNYIDLFQVNVPYLMNSLIVTLVSTLGVLLLSVPAAFGLTAFNFPKKHDLEMWFLSGRMMPPVAAGSKVRTRLPAIEGEPFDPTCFPVGCRFAPRCVERMDVCSRRYPGEFLPEPSRPVNCFKYGE